jgi:hypothetical protein
MGQCIAIDEARRLHRRRFPLEEPTRSAHRFSRRHRSREGTLKAAFRFLAQMCLWLSGGWAAEGRLAIRPVSQPNRSTQDQRLQQGATAGRTLLNRRLKLATISGPLKPCVIGNRQRARFGHEQENGSYTMRFQCPVQVWNCPPSRHASKRRNEVTQ